MIWSFNHFERHCKSIKSKVKDSLGKIEIFFFVILIVFYRKWYHNWYPSYAKYDMANLLVLRFSIRASTTWPSWKPDAETETFFSRPAIKRPAVQTRSESLAAINYSDKSPNKTSAEKETAKVERVDVTLIQLSQKVSLNNSSDFN